MDFYFCCLNTSRGDVYARGRSRFGGHVVHIFTIEHGHMKFRRATPVRGAQKINCAQCIASVRWNDDARQRPRRQLPRRNERRVRVFRFSEFAEVLLILAADQASEERVGVDLVVHRIKRANWLRAVDGRAKMPRRRSIKISSVNHLQSCDARARIALPVDSIIQDFADAECTRRNCRGVRNSSRRPARDKPRHRASDAGNDRPANDNATKV